MNGDKPDGSLCYNCGNATADPVLVNCNEPGCLWGLLICKPCYDTKIGDGSQHAVIEARQHASKHFQYMLVRLNESSDTKGQLIGWARNEEEIKVLLKSDVETHGKFDYLVHDTRSKKSVRVNVKSSPLVYDGGRNAKDQSTGEEKSPVEAETVSGNDGSPETDRDGGPSAA